ncbi:hypothetical protein V1478_010854 [Vespula squamosa]|uniref:Uncharacterized protein n=1 Tax=Vespula squamosa TaxID=30214 RepID=A0ABD2AGH8_VESSQ
MRSDKVEIHFAKIIFVINILTLEIEMAPKKGIKKVHKGTSKSKNELRCLKNDCSFTSTSDTSFSSDCSDCDCSDCDCSDCYDQCPLTSRKSSKGRSKGKVSKTSKKKKRSKTKASKKKSSRRTTNSSNISSIIISLNKENPRPLAAVPRAIVIPVVMEIATTARHQKVKLVVKIRHTL